MDKEKAIRASKNGAYAAFVSAALTTIITIYAIYSNADNDLALWNDPTIFIDIILIMICGFGMLYYYRAAAIFIFIYFLISKIYIGIETMSFVGIGTSLVFLYFFAKAIQGTFVYHRITKAESPERKSTSKWLYYVIIPIIIIFVIIMGFGLLSTTGYLPSAEVVKGKDMSEKHIYQLTNNGIIDTNENIEYFYSEGFTSILEGGNVLTDKRIIVYAPDENDELMIYGIPFNQISTVELIEEGNYMNPSVYEVRTFQEGAWIRLFLSTSNRGDIKFVEALRNKMTN